MDERPKCKTGSLKILEEKAGKNLFDLGRSNFLPNMSPEARKTKAKMNYWDLTKIKMNKQTNKTFCTVKETINKTKRQLTEWEKIFANDISDKGLVSKIYKELIKLNTQKTNNPVKKWAEDMNRYFSQEDIHPDGQQTHEKMLNVTHHQANTNQSHTEKPPHTYQSG